MKTLKLFFICAWIWLSGAGYAQADAKNDSIRLTRVENSVVKIEKKQDSTNKQLAPLIKSYTADTTHASGENKGYRSAPIRCWEGYYVVLLPLIFSVIFLIIILRGLRGFKLADALTEKNPNKVVGFVEVRKIQLARAAAEPFDDPAGPSPEIPTSTSRLIAFLSGIAAIILSLCLTTFYMYYYLTIGTVPSEFKDLWWGVVVLGIGIIPYASAQLVSHKP
jgi:hypothetical protein